MTSNISNQDTEEIKAILNNSSSRNLEPSFIKTMLVFMMMSLIAFSFSMIFWDAVEITFFSSVSVLSVLSMVGASLQIYSFSSDTRGY